VTNGYRQLNGDEIRRLLGELLDRAAAEGIEVDAYIIGGAAMALHLGREELTPNIDGIFHPYEELKRIGALMSAEYGLDPDWVNNNASPFITFDPSDGSNFDEVEVGGHRIRIASKRALLAMKMGRAIRSETAGAATSASRSKRSGPRACPPRTPPRSSR
jgi:hypothetical protein